MSESIIRGYLHELEGRYDWCSVDQAECVLLDYVGYQNLLADSQKVEHADNIIRIQRERANADRGMTPKKQRSGYVIQDWRKKTVQVSGRGVNVVQIKLQTPFLVKDYRRMIDVVELVKTDLLALFPFINNWDDCLSHPGRDNIGYELSCICTGNKYWSVEFRLKESDLSTEIPEDLI